MAGLITQFFNQSKKRGAEDDLSLSPSLHHSSKRARTLEETPLPAVAAEASDNSTHLSVSSASSSTAVLPPIDTYNDSSPTTRHATNNTTNKCSRSCHMADAVHGQVLQVNPTQYAMVQSAPRCMHSS